MSSNSVNNNLNSIQQTPLTQPNDLNIHLTDTASHISDFYQNLPDDIFYPLSPLSPNRSYSHLNSNSSSISYTSEQLSSDSSDFPSSLNINLTGINNEHFEEPDSLASFLASPSKQQSLLSPSENHSLYAFPSQSPNLLENSFPSPIFQTTEPSSLPKEPPRTNNKRKNPPEKNSEQSNKKNQNNSESSSLVPVKIPQSSIRFENGILFVQSPSISPLSQNVPNPSNNSQTTDFSSNQFHPSLPISTPPQQFPLPSSQANLFSSSTSFVHPKDPRHPYNKIIHPKVGKIILLHNLLTRANREKAVNAFRTREGILETSLSDDQAINFANSVCAYGEKHSLRNLALKLLKFVGLNPEKTFAEFHCDPEKETPQLIVIKSGIERQKLGYSIRFARTEKGIELQDFAKKTEILEGGAYLY